MQTNQSEKVINLIEKSFSKQVQKDKNLESAFLLVHSERNSIHLHIAEGAMNPKQPAYMASVGKIFTSVLISMLYENGKISFEDRMTNYLNPEIVKHLHVYEGKDYTNDIKIKHLLNQTSGLYDNFRPLLNKVLDDPYFTISPQEAIIWAKTHQKPHFPPGNGFKYTDTNYHLLGLIIENLTGIPFHEALKQFIYQPLGMMNSSMLHYSDPLDKNTQHLSDFYINKNKLTNHKGYAGLDYAGGGVVSTGEDLLKFMKALVSYQLVKKETLEMMMNDKAKYGVGIDYGYGIMQFKTVPLLMPKIFNVWGHAGATGSYMFYHPKMDTYLIGTFNDFSYERKGVKFMLMKVINKLNKII
ncbi:serine hydrolase domain-containing protein [Metabacillus niabensis]|uniref:serine hydrolase domain-containing protein n=1 Tax=Metabacillus niabensis TaxID=324854 RepID=UPI0039A14D6A